MPELPEVETVRAGLEPVLRGRSFVRVEQRRPDLRFPLPDRFAERLTGRRVLRLGRRAKYILVELDQDEVLAIHLGMTGRLIVSNGSGAAEDGGAPGAELGAAVAASAGIGAGGSPDAGTSADDAPAVGIGTGGSPTAGIGADDAPAADGAGLTLGQYAYSHGKDAKHDHLVFTMSGGAVVTYNDARRFGYMTLILAGELDRAKFFCGLGVEPLGPGLTGVYLAARARGKKADLKAFLMDQRIVAGLGNIYVCEALFRAGLDPWKGAARLATRGGKPTPVAERLAAAIKAVLTDAIRAGGSTLRDYKQADGSSGLFQNEFGVYGRADAPCAKPGCGGTVRRKTQGGRSTFFCPACQR